MEQISDRASRGSGLEFSPRVSSSFSLLPSLSAFSIETQATDMPRGAQNENHAVDLDEKSEVIEHISRTSSSHDIEALSESDAAFTRATK